MTPSRHLWWLGASALAFSVFLRITRELLEGEVASQDSAIFRAVAGLRTPWLTTAAVDVTALGSVTVITLVCAVALGLFLALGQRLAALQLFAASIGAALLTVLAKGFIERVRPAELPPLVVVSGFSYPSGHSLATSAVYLTLAIVARRYTSGLLARIALFAATLLTLLLIAASRVYLGVHYATDVASGLSLGAAWAFLLSAAFAYFDRQTTARPVTNQG